MLHFVHNFGPRVFSSSMEKFIIQNCEGKVVYRVDNASEMELWQGRVQLKSGWSKVSSSGDLCFTVGSDNEVISSKASKTDN